MATSTDPHPARPRTEFRRDRLTWVAYALLAWFAYLQAAPGLVIAHLRDGEPRRRRVLRAARARARAARAVLVGDRADGRRGGRLDGGADRRGGIVPVLLVLAAASLTLVRRAGLA
jgi:hypothetical protein